VIGSRSATVATLLSVAAAVIGVAAYFKACGVEAPPPQVTTARDPALELAIQRLETRVAALARGAPPPSAFTPPPADASEAPTPTAVPTLADGSASGSGTGSAAAARTETPDQHKRRVAVTVEMYWRDWADRNSLEAKQTQALVALQVDASARRLDSQARMISKEITQTALRAENVLVTEDVRRKARELLTPDQFARFEADRGAETGSSYRAVRDALTKSATAAGR
jgi:hypothetical protein